MSANETETELEGSLSGPLSTMFDPGSSEIIEGTTAEGTYRVVTGTPELLAELGLDDLMLTSVQVAIDQALEGKSSLLAALEPSFVAEVEQKLLAQAGEYDGLGFRLVGLSALTLTFTPEALERLKKVAPAVEKPRAKSTLRVVGTRPAAPPAEAPRAPAPAGRQPKGAAPARRAVNIRDTDSSDATPVDTPAVKRAPPVAAAAPRVAQPVPEPASGGIFAVADGLGPSAPAAEPEPGGIFAVIDRAAQPAADAAPEPGGHGIFDVIDAAKKP